MGNFGLNAKGETYAKFSKSADFLPQIHKARK